MPRQPTPAQIAASRANGARSQGPVTPEGKATSAMNAVEHGLRSVEVTLTKREEPERLRLLHADVVERYRPVTPVEHSLCAAIAAALWQQERARDLEAQLLDFQGRRIERELAYPLVWQILQEDKPARGLETILRYQARAENALKNAIKALAAIRQERAEPVRDCTNEPENPQADPPAEPPPAPAEAVTAPMAPAAPVLPVLRPEPVLAAGPVPPLLAVLVVRPPRFQGFHHRC